MANNAAAVVPCHNHPSGIAEPSQADELITRRLKEALSLVDIRVLEHLIVGDGVVESFRGARAALAPEGSSTAAIPFFDYFHCQLIRCRQA